MKRKIAVLFSIMLIGVMAMSSLRVLSDATADDMQIEQTRQTAQVRFEGNVYQPVLSNGRFCLWLLPDTGDFYVENTAESRVWRSIPADAADDEAATGYTRAYMQSALAVRYINGRSALDEVFSYTGSVQKSAVACGRDGESVIITYDFPKQGFSVPISLTLSAGGLSVSVLNDQITESGKNLVSEVDLLPYFGAASYDENGYLVVPDGSGAIVGFTSAREVLGGGVNYKKEIYGRDPMYNRFSVDSREEDIKLPVFGISTENGGVLGIVSEGDALACLQILFEGVGSGYSSIHSVMQIRTTDSYIINQYQKNEKTLLAVNKKKSAVSRYTVEYFLLDAGACDYSAMARRTADYYSAMYRSEEKASRTPTLLLRLLGAVKKQGSILGIPMEKVFPVTTFTQAQIIVDEIKTAGCSNLSVVYDGVFSGGVYGEIPTKAKLEGKLGSSGQFAALLEKLESQQGNLSLAADLVRIYESGGGVSYRRDAARNKGGGIGVLTRYLQSTFTQDTSGLTWTILKPARQNDIYTEFLENLKKKGPVGFADMSAGLLTSDNYKGFGSESKIVDRAQALVIQKENLALVGKCGAGYSAGFAESYVLPYAEEVFDIPSGSSGYRCFTADIPFYELVASNFSQLYSKPFNLSGGVDDFSLKQIEYGLLPSYYFCYADSGEITDTDANWLYAGNYQNWAGDCAQLMKDNRKAYELIAGHRMFSHERLEDDVFIITYDNGEALCVNYRKDPYVLEGRYDVPPSGYLILPYDSNGEAGDR